MINNNSLNTSILLDTIADLVNMLMEHGANENGSIEHTLKYYGFTDKQIKEWYGLGE
jgi:hypothetical protein